MDGCPTPDRWRDYLNNRVGPDEEAVFVRHAESCPACNAALESLLAEADPPPAFAVPPPADAAPPGLVRRLQCLADLPLPRPGDGPTIAGYETVRELGRGGAGVVYLARCRSTGRLVALKVIAAGELADPEDARRFHAEAEAVAKLGGAAVVPVYDHGTADGVHYLAMQFVPGGSLRRRLEDLAREPRQAARLVAEAARAADAMHRLGVIHRDIKPDNVLLQPAAAAPPSEEQAGTLPLAQYAALLADFGLAKRPGDGTGKTATGAIVGTPGYMAPEQIRHGEKPTPAADVYSLGATLYACLAGVPPFQGPTPFDTLKRVESGDPVSPAAHNPRVPRDLAAVCLKCLENDPARRYPTAEALADDLERFLGGKPVHARRPGPARRGARWLRRNPRKALFGLLLAAAVVTGWAFQRREIAFERERREFADNKLTLEVGLRAEAERAARVEKRAAQDARIDAARQAARRGDWPTALAEYRRALDGAEPAEALRLRVERLFGYFAVNDTDELERELKALGGEELGALAPKVLLARGALDLCDSGRQEKGRARAREALEARRRLKTPEDVFTPADVAYAEGLAEPRAHRAVASLRTAVERDPLHYPANSALLVALCVVGDLPEARRQAAFMRSVFPDSPVPGLGDALAALFAGDRPAMRAGVDEFGRKLGPARRADAERFRRFLEGLADVLDVMDGFDAQQGGLSLWDLAKLIKTAPPELGPIGGRAVPASRPLALPIPTVGLLFTHWKAVLGAYLESTLNPKRDVALRRLLAACEDHPEPALLVLAAAMRLRASVDHINADRLGPMRVEMEAAAELSARAATAPTVLPRSPVRYNARLLGTAADLALLKMIRDPGPLPMARLRDGLHGLVTEGRRWKRDREKGLGMLVGLITVPLTKGQTAEWNLDDPAGKEAYRQRMRSLYWLGRGLLEDWSLDEPENKAVRKHVETLGRWAEAEGLFAKEDPAGAK